MFNVDYFIEKFSGIPNIMWTTGAIKNHYGQHCALGLCIPSFYGKAQEGELNDIMHIFDRFNVTILKNTSRNGYEKNDVVCNKWAIAAINNGETVEYQQDTPKERILAALSDIKAAQVEYKDITKELAVLPAEETADIKLVLEK